jgi:mannosyl-oligosaccharide glucosidase
VSARILSHIHYLQHFAGPYNNAVETGAHSNTFAERIGKTHYLGLRLSPGTIWQAKDPILQNIIKQAQETLQDYKDPTIGTPDPSFVLQLTDDVYTGSNLYAVQKLFDGEFSFDVFFESGSSKQKLSSMSSYVKIWMWLTIDRILSSCNPGRRYPRPC